VKLLEVFRYEVGYRLRGATTWLYAAILFVVAFVAIHAQADGVHDVHVDAPGSVAMIAVAVGMFGMLVSAALFGDAAVRDAETGMEPLLFASPLGKAEYLGGRFLATLAVNALVLLAVPLGLAAATRMPYLDRAAFGPFRAATFVQPYLLFLLPNLVLAGAVLFAVGVLARQVIPVYLAAIGLAVGFLVGIQSLGQSENPVLALLGDPLGIAALHGMTEYWTAAEQNARLVGFPAALLWNRLAWLAAALGVLAVLHRGFRFAHPDGAGGRRERRRAQAPAMPERAGPLAVPRVRGSFGPRTRARQTLAVAQSSLARTVASRSFAVVVLAYVGLTFLFGWGEVGSTPFDTSTWPVTFLVAETVLDTPIVPITFLLLALYAGELVWKEREEGTSEIADATPVPEGALLLGRFLALVAMLAVLQAAIMAGSILIQALQGYGRFEPGLYLRIFFGMKLADLVLLAALAIAVHVVVNHKYLGHIVVLMACLFPVVAGESGVVRHHLLLYGTDPGWTYSDMNGFGPFTAPFVWFKLYWAAWALLLGVVAVLFWVRGREPGVRRRLRGARERLAGPVARIAGAAALLIVALGGFIFYNTNVLNDPHAADRLTASRAHYEARYRRFAGAPQPTLVSAGLRMEIYPGRPAVDIRGGYLLVNRTAAVIDSVHVLFVDPAVQARSITFDRPARAVLADPEARYRIFALERPLAPGDSLRLAFDVAFRPRGFPDRGIQTDVVRNGAYFNRSWLPFVGYQPAFELRDDEARARFGLAPRPPLPGPAAAGARRFRLERLDADLVEVETVVGTDAGQTAVTPGVLLGSWTRNGRRYFHYRTRAPVPFGAAVFSARYAVLHDRWNGVALDVYHHPAHGYDLDRMVRAMKASLAYYTRSFGPYPDRQLRIVEIPRYGGSGSSHPHTVAFTEDNFLSRVKPGEIDQPFFGTAHEVAHQWWGGQVRGAPVRGHGFLSESLANYSAMMVTEKTYGAEVARRVYDFQMEHYLSGRASRSGEVPLLEVEDQPYIAYRKGAVALYTLRGFIGEDAVNTALRRYLEKYRGGPPYPTSLDLYAELRAMTPDSLRPLLTDLFETVTLWDVRTVRATAEPAGAGAYRVTLEVVARKTRVDRAGNETAVPMDDLVEIGVFAPRQGGRPGKPLYLRRHRIHAGRQTIRVTVPAAPARAGIDPYARLIDRQRGDNVVDVGTTGARRTGTAP